MGASIGQNCFPCTVRLLQFYAPISFILKVRGLECWSWLNLKNWTNYIKEDRDRVWGQKTARE